MSVRQSIFLITSTLRGLSNIIGTAGISARWQTDLQEILKASQTRKRVLVLLYEAERDRAKGLRYRRFLRLRQILGYLGGWEGREVLERPRK